MMKLSEGDMLRHGCSLAGNVIVSAGKSLCSVEIALNVIRRL